MGKLFLGKGYAILALYSRKQGVVYAEPPHTSHLAHVTWLNPSARSDINRSNIDLFLIDKEMVSDYEREQTTNFPLVHHPKYEQVMKDYGIHIQTNGECEDLVKQIIVWDVANHNKDKPKPNVHSEPKVSFLSPIYSTARLIPIKEAELTLQGKQTFYPECIFDLNLDFANWCISGITPEGKLAPWLECDYCYAGYQHSGYPYVYSVDKKNLAEQIKKLRADNPDKRIRYARLGKRTEVGTTIFRSQLMNTLEAFLEEGIIPIIPTKFLEFDKDVAELLKRTQATLLYSLGNDKFEQGAVLHGKTNDWRFEQSRKYADSGANAIPYVLVDAVKNYGGEHFSQNFRRAVAEFHNIQLLPIRLRHPDVAHRILGGWHSVIGERGHDLTGHMTGGYEKAKDATRIHRVVHQSINDLIGDNNWAVRMCSHNHSCTWCGKCFVPDEKGVIVPTKTVVVPKVEKKKYGGRMKDGLQPRLFY